MQIFSKHQNIALKSNLLRCIHIFDASEFTDSLGLLTVWGGLVTLKKQPHTLPEAVVPDTVDDYITATVSC